MRSMTGYGFGRIQRDGWEVTAELKTVNHRFLDLSMRLPRNIAFLEQVVRGELAKGLKRGHVDIFITVRNTESSAMDISAGSSVSPHRSPRASRTASVTSRAEAVSAV